MSVSSTPQCAAATAHSLAARRAVGPRRNYLLARGAKSATARRPPEQEEQTGCNWFEAEAQGRAETEQTRARFILEARTVFRAHARRALAPGVRFP